MNSLVTTRRQEGGMGTICNVMLRIKKIRTQLGWSQEKLAEIANIDRKTVSRFEDGQHDVKWHCIRAMLTALGIQMCEECAGCRDNGSAVAPPQEKK